MKLATLAVLALVLLPVGASHAAEATPDSPAPRLDGVTVGDLLPKTLRPKLVNPWSATIDLADGTDGKPVRLTVDMMVDDEPGVTFSMIYTEGFMLEALQEIIAKAESGGMADLPVTLDAEFAEGQRCHGMVEQVLITCAIGDKAGFQFSAYRLDGTPYDYERAKDIFLSIPFDRFAEIAAGL